MTVTLGSSPLARGKSGEAFTGIYELGFILTRAGKIRQCGLASSSLSVHPHSRGENDDNLPVTVPCSGSSPLARGKLDNVDASTTQHRFIPTRAGKITLGLARPAGAPVHPHSRGENSTRVKAGQC